MDHTLDYTDLCCGSTISDGAESSNVKMHIDGRNTQLSVSAENSDRNNGTGTHGSAAVRSKAVVTYSASKSNAVYLRLPPHTDLNHAPSNWLRKTIGLGPEALLTRSKYAGKQSNQFSGFAMAGSHLQHIGKIDVVSDAENVKKLLKMPYSDAHVSMTIHRVGRTLLFEDFDLKKYANEDSQWKDFRNFCQGVLRDHGNPLKKKRPSSQYDRMMHSKFLYYSVDKDLQKKLTNFSLTQASSKENSDVGCQGSGAGLHKTSEVDKPVQNVQAIPIENPHVYEKRSTSSDRRWQYWSAKDNNSENPQAYPKVCDDDPVGFERNIFWTFEDLKMILGTNMPIFGGGKYPAVSLRLRDSQKPINVLTGIDYWLDNLICNVPELVMCFHVDGIVQNYECIKTDEIPKLTDSGFSPQVIKDIAQNILSFLKSNCTKEGHTYWLFKGSGDDVVKLYDLSTLCQDDSQSTHRQNPYVISVAMLLYKTALNLMQSLDMCNHHVTVKKLLLHCVELLDQKEHHLLVGRAVCLLSDLCLHKSCIPQLHTEIDSSSKRWKTCDTCAAYLEAEINNSNGARHDEEEKEIASISHVSDLYYPEKFVGGTQTNRVSQESGCSKPSSDLEKTCMEASKHIVTGFSLLAKDHEKSDNGYLLQRLSENGAKLYLQMAQRTKDNGSLGHGLKKIQIALQCYETFTFLVSKFGTLDSTSMQTSFALNDDVYLLPKILSLCGEIQFQLLQEIRANGQPKTCYYEERQHCTEDDKKILLFLDNICQSGVKYGELTKIQVDLNDTLKVCARCYEIALKAMNEHGVSETDKFYNSTSLAIEDDKMQRPTKGAENTNSECSHSYDFQEFKNMIIRRNGHVINEMGASLLNNAVDELNQAPVEDIPTKTMSGAWNKAASYFQRAYDCFCLVNDYMNQALVLSNTGRLMRVSARMNAKKDIPLSAKERASFESAISSYEKALGLLNSKEVRRKSEISETCSLVKDNISWDLSTCYFTMAQLMQDSGFDDHSTRTKLETDVIGWLKNSLKYCKSIWKNSAKFPIALYRHSKLYHRLASLYHNSYRGSSESQQIEYLRGVAEKYYGDAVRVLEQLDHPDELLRIQLERLAMMEYQLSTIDDATIKLNSLIDGLHLVCRCSCTLITLKESLSEKLLGRLSEVGGLLRILVTILQSLLLSLVKLMSSRRSNLNSQIRRRFKRTTTPQICKDLYVKSLKNLQPVLAREDFTFESIHADLSVAVDILNEISNLIY